MSSFESSRWIWGPRADLVVFGGSAALALALVALAPLVAPADGATPLWAWLLLVVAVDVGHVWSTLFRTYLDRDELRRRPLLYAGVPLVCFAVAFALHLRSDVLFWRVLAYAAVFHFVRQQVGWVAIYRAKAGERQRLDRVIDEAAIYAATLYPVAFWHAHLPRAFRWFVEDDFVALPWLSAVLPVLHLAWACALVVYGLRAAWKVTRGELANIGKHVVVATTAATWYVGIVITNADFAFTAANVIVHGVPYVALLWAYARERSREAARSPIATLVRAGWPVFLLILLGLALGEELLWDRLLWHARPEVFGSVEVHLPPFALAAAVAVLAVPQATHYVLDAVLWRRGETGPAQARALGFRPRGALLAACLTLLAAFSIGCHTSRDLTIAPPDEPSRRAAGAAPASREDGRLPAIARPTRYGLAIVLDPAKERFTGDATIDIELLEKTAFVVLHGRGLSVLRAEVTVGGTTTPVNVDARPTAVGAGDEEELVVRLPRELPPGPIRVHLAYSAALSEGLTGAFRVKDGADWYVFTQFEPMDARRALPCFDEPGFKTPFDVKITVPKGQLAVSNMPEASRATSEDGRRTTFSFDSSPPLPTYLLAFAVGPLELREAKNAPVPLRVVATRHKAKLGDAALATAAEQIGALSAYFDMAFPYPKLDLVAIPEFGAGAMENAGLITFREDILLLDGKAAGPRARRRMESVMAHEIAHHWFGNLVTMSWWDDLWLNEGVATFFESRIPALMKQESDPTTQLLARTTAMSLDALDSSRPVRMPVKNANDAEAAFDAIVYDKGARVVDMLEGWLGEDVFRDGLRRHVRAHPHGSATASDLFQALSEASKEDVGAVASTFLDRAGVPLVRAALICEGGAARVNLTQSRYRARERRVSDPKDPPWTIPVCVDVEGRAPLCTLLSQPSAELPIPGGRCPRWMYPNAAERGYYRSSLDEAGFRALARAGTALDARVRFGALDNAWALAESGDASVDVLFDLLEGLRRDRSRLVVERVATALRDLDRAVIDDRSRAAFARFAAAQLSPIAREVGWEPAPAEGEDRAALRRATLGALAVLVPDRIAKEAEPRARLFLDAVERGAIAPGEGAAATMDLDVAAIALRAVARGADEALWTRLGGALRTAKDANERNALLGALANVGNPTLLERSLELTVTGNLRKQESITLLVAAGERSDARALVVSWLERRAAQLRAKVPTPSLLVRAIDAVAPVCDAKLQAQVGRFLPRAMEGVDGADRRIDQALEGMQRCVALRAREADRAAKRLP